MSISAKDILRGVGAGLHGAATALPAGLERTAISGAVVIVDTIRAVMDDEGLSVAEVVSRIKRVPPIDTSADDASVDAIVDGLPSRED